MAAVSSLTSVGDNFVSGEYNEYNLTNSSYAVQFNGSGQYLTVAANVALVFNANFTVEAWVYATSAVAGAHQIFNYGNFTFMLYHNSTAWTVEVGNGINANYFTLSGTASLNAWHHFAITRSGNTYTFWIDGLSASTTSNVNAPNTTSKQLSIGRSENGLGEYFAGYISNFRIVKGTAVYTVAFNPPYSPLTNITNTSLLTLQNPTIIDNGTANTGGTGFTISNPASATTLLPSTNWMTTKSKQFSNGTFQTLGTLNEITLQSTSLTFNGINQYISLPTSTFLSVVNNTYTVEMFISVSAYPAASTELYQVSNATTAAFGSFEFTLNSIGKIVVYVRPSTGAAVVTVTSTASVPLYTWTHVAVSVNNGSLTVYINGSSSGTGTVVALNGTQTFCSIGYLTNGYTTGQNYFSGFISNLRVLKGTALYSGSTITIPTEVLPSITNTSVLIGKTPLIEDQSTNLVTITNPNSITVDSIQTKSYRWRFDGTTNISITANALYSLPADFTVETWISLNSAQTVSLFDSTGTGIFGIILTTTTLQVTASNVNTFTFNLPFTLTYNTFYHIAVVRIGTQVTVYLNGVAATPQTITYSYSSATAWAVGRNPNANQNHLIGYISNLRVVKGTGVYTTNFIPSTKNLENISGTILLLAQTSNIVESSGSGLIITNTGVTSQAPLFPSSPKSKLFRSGEFQITGSFDEVTGIV